MIYALYNEDLGVMFGSSDYNHHWTLRNLEHNFKPLYLLGVADGNTSDLNNIRAEVQVDLTRWTDVSDGLLVYIEKNFLWTFDLQRLKVGEI